MLASVLNSDRAIELSVLVVQAFVEMRQYLRTHAELSTRVDELERRLGTHDPDLGVDQGHSALILAARRTEQTDWIHGQD